MFPSTELHMEVVLVIDQNYKIKYSVSRYMIELFYEKLFIKKKK